MSTIPEEASRDKDRKRATYEVTYPVHPLVVQSLEDLPQKDEGQERRLVRGKIVSFKLQSKTIDLVEFLECNFHDQDGKGPAQIKDLTFRNCRFERSMLGSTEYTHIRFEDCNFSRTDFQNSHFSDCLFVNSSMSNCTATKTTFEETELSPRAFFKGVVFPSYNHHSSTPETKIEATEEFLENQLRLARLLSRSNSEVGNSAYADEGLYQVKLTEAKINQISIGKSSFLKSAASIFNLIIGYTNLLATKGGTSLRRLVVGLIVLIVITPFVMPSFDLKYDGKPLTLSWNGMWSGVGDYLFCTFASSSLYLGFGFTHFSAKSASGNIFLIVCACIGFVWIAMFAPVLIRRIYK